MANRYAGRGQAGLVDKKKSTGKKKDRLSRRSGEKKNQDEYAMLRKGTPIG